MKKEDIFRAVGGAEDKFIEEFAQDKPKRRPWRGILAAAACFCLLLGGLVYFQPWRSAPTEPPVMQNMPSETGKMTDPAESVNPSVALDALPELTFAEGDGQLSMDIALPDGHFTRTLTSAQVASIWGVDALDWDCEATAIYDGTGRIWIATVQLITAQGEVSIQLSPEILPPRCIVYDGGATCEVYGTEVTALRLDNYTEISFLRGEGESAVGVRIEATGADETLLTQLVAQSLREDGALQLDQLRVAEVPAWRSEALTETQIYDEAGFGEYLPQAPAGFAFESAYREMGEDRNYLSVTWCRDYDSLSVTVDKQHDGRGLVHAEQVERYDKSLYESGLDVPEEYWDSWQRPIFYAEEVTMEVLLRRAAAVDMGNSLATFGVLYPDGTVVRINLCTDLDEFETILSFLLA